MPDTLTELLDQKVATLRQISELGDFRPGSISTTTGRCGNPNCRCHRPGASGHGPNFRLTYKAQGKTITESFPSPAARQKAEREIAAYRRWQQLSSDFVETNASICRLRPVEALTPSAEEKKRPKRSARKSRAK
ncbi:MAG: hypothetical protein KGM47_15880 [Acidobacteriota bacterium]|nr:hypothetical protein [Acidobacteriota bacterium]